MVFSGVSVVLGGGKPLASAPHVGGRLGEEADSLQAGAERAAQGDGRPRQRCARQLSECCGAQLQLTLVCTAGLVHGLHLLVVPCILRDTPKAVGGETLPWVDLRRDG